MHFSLGIVGELPPLDQGFGPAPGLSLRVHYEAKSWELGGDIRFGDGQATSTAPRVGFFMAELGGRYFFNETDVTPYIGGGIGWEYLNLQIPSIGFAGDNEGLGVFGEVGVEFLRTYHTHLSVGARLDLPFFSINDNGFESCPLAPNTFSTTTCGGQSAYYYAPLSIELRLTF